MGRIEEFDERGDWRGWRSQGHGECVGWKGTVGVGMNLGGIMLYKGLGGAECREVRGESTPSAVTQTEVVFQVSGKREGKIKCKAVRTGASSRGSQQEVVASAKVTAGMSTWEKVWGEGGEGGQWDGEGDGYG